VTELLAASGVAATAVQLPLTGLADDAAAVSTALELVGPDAVLVGHSYGGAVVTVAGVHRNVEELVYIAGFPLRAEESAWTVGSGEPGLEELDYTGRPDLAAHLTVTDGVAELSPAGATALFYADCPPDVAAAARRRLRPQRWSSLTDLPGAIAWTDRRSTYAVCDADRAVHPGLQRILARRTTTQVAWPTGHSPMLSHPGVVADLLARMSHAPVAAGG
jgi:pimeloyl-ACP methyl ester carboxylesterase